MKVVVKLNAKELHEIVKEHLGINTETNIVLRISKPRTCIGVTNYVAPNEWKDKSIFLKSWAEENNRGLASAYREWRKISHNYESRRTGKKVYIRERN
jgi:hypothetical protein